MEALLKRHVSEVALLNANIKSMAPKARFGRAPSSEALAAAERVAAEQREALAARHAAEVAGFSAALAAEAVVERDKDALAAMAASDGVEDEEGEGAVVAVSGGGGGGGAKLSRAERRRLKKEGLAAAEAAFNAEWEAPSEALRGGDAGARPPARDEFDTRGLPRGEREMLAILQQLRPLRLTIKKVPGDGSCLFRSVADQLALRSGGGGAHSHGALRTRTADFIRAFWEEFAPFLPYEPEDGFPSTGSGASVRDAVGRYCGRLAGTNMWGGHPEIRSLANVLGCSIVVYREGAPPLQFHPRGEELEGDAAATRTVLRVSFHAHLFDNAEHYNSVVPAT